jgi:hypothetical protein
MKVTLSRIVTPRRALALGTGLAVIAAVGVSAGPAAAQTDPLLAAARLQGLFALDGQITVAAHVRGERVGQAVSRAWLFSSSCSDGPCSTVTVLRQRAAGADAVTLVQRSAGYYVGYGSFTAPLLCGTTIYAAGEQVPFTITVRVTNAVVQSDGTVIATGIAATYGNGYRINLTRCVGVLGHDAAVYQGRLTGQAKDVKARRTVRRTTRRATGHPGKPAVKPRRR